MEKLEGTKTKLFTLLNIWIHKLLIKYLIDMHCGPSVKTSGEGSNSNNCFWLGFKKDANTYLGFEKYDHGNLVCRSYVDNSFVNEVTIAEYELVQHKIEFIHYVKSYRIEIQGVYKFLSTFLFYKTYVILITYWNNLSQLLFNQRSLSSKKRYQLLKLLIENFTLHNGGFSTVDVMHSLHSIKVFLHPSYNIEASRIEAILVGLTDTQELRLINGNYHLTGHAFKALDAYEEQDRRHTSMSRAQWALIFVTIGLLLATIIQAQIIKFPTIIDFN